jgi:Sel1 repeat
MCSWRYISIWKRNQGRHESGAYVVSKRYIVIILQNINILSILLFAAAEAGDLVARFTIGCMTYRGVETRMTLSQAREWIQEGRAAVNSSKYRHTLHASFSLAAEAGLPKAQNLLGQMHKRGGWVVQDHVKAAEWIKKGMLSRILQDIKTFSVLLLPAAKAGDRDAQLRLAEMFEFGDGVEKNPIKVVEWFQKGMLLQIPQKIQHTQRASFASR